MEVSNPAALTDAQIKHMVDRFLGWRLPENFSPDCGISFDADAGETAEPEPEHALAPRPTPDGPWLLIMHDENASGGMWMRRYAKKEDAMCVSANYTGSRQTWLFEVVGEHDIQEAMREFWAHVEIA